MKQRIALNLDRNVLDNVDAIRGMIPRSRFINSALEQKIEQIKESGGVIGQI